MENRKQFRRQEFLVSAQKWSELSRIPGAKFLDIRHEGKYLVNLAEVDDRDYTCFIHCHLLEFCQHLTAEQRLARFDRGVCLRHHGPQTDSLITGYCW